jgi:predicted transcriptional regulator
MIMQSRESVGLSRAGLSELCGVSQSHLSKVERGKVRVGRQAARKFAHALGLPVEALMMPQATEDFTTPPPETSGTEIMPHVLAMIEVDADVAAMARMVAAGRGLTTAEYLGATLRQSVRADLASECGRFLSGPPTGPDP